MTKITYIEFNGTEHIVDVKPGLTVMEGAVKNNIPGIAAECGGARACATSHVYVDRAWFEKTGECNAMEEFMLDLLGNVKANSRLACRIRVTEELDGVVARMLRSRVAASPPARGAFYTSGTAGAYPRVN